MPQYLEVLAWHKQVGPIISSYCGTGAEGSCGSTTRPRPVKWARCRQCLLDMQPRPRTFLNMLCGLLWEYGLTLFGRSFEITFHVQDPTLWAQKRFVGASHSRSTQKVQPSLLAGMCQYRGSLKMKTRDPRNWPPQHGFWLPLFSPQEREAQESHRARGSEVASGALRGPRSSSRSWQGPRASGLGRFRLPAKHGSTSHGEHSPFLRLIDA